MAIEKNNFKVSRFDSDFSPGSGESISSDEDDIQHRSSGVESDEDDDDDEFDDADSGAGSDDFDLLELGETSAEFCQVGNQTCSLPFELFDLLGLEEILSVDVWNECLSEDERMGLAKYLPDMDLETYNITLKELFTGCNIHFGSPLKKLFEMIKGGLCEPRAALYREGLVSFEKRKHYHLLRKHQNTMVSNLCQIRDAWLSCRGYSIEEKLRVLNIMKTQKSLMHEKEDMVSESSDKEEMDEGVWSKRVKDRKFGQKGSRSSSYQADMALDYLLPETPVALEPIKHRKKNQKGILKLGGSKTPSAKELAGGFPSMHHNSDLKSIPYGSVPPSRRNKDAGFDLGMSQKIRDLTNDEDEDPIFGAGPRKDHNISRRILTDTPAFLKPRRKHELLGGEDFITEEFVGLPLSSKGDLHVFGRNKNINQSSEIMTLTAKHNIKSSQNLPKITTYPDYLQGFAAEDQIMPVRGRTSQLPLRGHRGNFSDLRTKEDVLPLDTQFDNDKWNARKKKLKRERSFPDPNAKFLKTSAGKFGQEKKKVRGSFRDNRGMDAAGLRVSNMAINGDATDSDSSDPYDDEEGSHPMRSKFGYPSNFVDDSRSPFVKSCRDIFIKKGTKETARSFEGIPHIYEKRGDFGKHLYMPEEESFPLKAKQKGKMRDSPYTQTSAGAVSGSYFSGLGDNDRRKSNILGKDGQFPVEVGEKLPMSSLKAHRARRKERAEVSHGDYIIEHEDDPIVKLLPPEKREKSSGKKGKNGGMHGHDRRERSESSLPGSNSVTKKPKMKEDVMDIDHHVENSNFPVDLQKQTDDSNTLKKRTKKKFDADGGTLDNEVLDTPITEAAVTDLDNEKPKKKTFTLITPTVHTGFSFSIIHLLSAVRVAMITPLPEDSLNVGRHMADQTRGNEVDTSGVSPEKNMDANSAERPMESNVPSLSIQEIVNRVRSNPGDPCILETQEPLQDLVRGVLKIYSSKTAPLGAKGWKALVVYEKSAKNWSWVGPVSSSALDHDTMEEVTSPEAWVLPHKTLVKLVDSFANWLKSGQETLQQIGSLPPPPASLLQFNLDEKERFRDLRAQKSLNTISPSSEEVRDYFRKEEVLRYSIPDRAFSYTAADGKKSIVAPLRRCGGKPTSKARDHFMLKRDRPPHVTILCLVRDAAARLPGSIGTRADVCTLIRDSQYIVEDVSDAQVNQVVSGALDRLHYERDPCVQFDAERKLWKYLHREREEEDFEDDGTSSTKKWKRPRKDAAEQQDPGAVTVAIHGTGEQVGLDVCSDLNVEPAGPDDDKMMDPTFGDTGQTVEDNVDINIPSEQAACHDQSMAWEGLDLNPTRENKLLCQENSTNEDFDDEAFGRDRPIGLLSASLL